MKGTFHRELKFPRFPYWLALARNGAVVITVIRNHLRDSRNYADTKWGLLVKWNVAPEMRKHQRTSHIDR